MRIYISTAMTGRSLADVERQQAEWSALLRDAGFEPVVPSYDPGAGQGVVIRDFGLIATCDAIVLDASRPSWGAAMEAYYGLTLGVAVVAVFPGDPRDASPFLRYVTTLAPDVGTAVEHLKFNVVKMGEWFVTSCEKELGE